MTYLYAKVQGQWSVGSEDRVKTNGGTDRRMVKDDYITSLANAVSNKCTCKDVININTYNFNNQSINQSNSNKSKTMKIDRYLINCISYSIFIKLG